MPGTRPGMTSPRQLLRIRNTSTSPLCDLPSTWSPVSRIRLGMSISASGSVHSTTRMSPAGSLDNALRARSAGSGHLSPRRLMVVSAILCLLGRHSPCRGRYVKAGGRAGRERGLAGPPGSGSATYRPMVDLRDAAQRIERLTPLADALAGIDRLVAPVAPRTVETRAAGGRTLAA